MRPSFFRNTGADLVPRLDLLEALLDRGLALVGREDLGGREAAIGAEQRVHAVALLIVVDGCLVGHSSPALLTVAQPGRPCSPSRLAPTFPGLPWDRTGPSTWYS